MMNGRLADEGKRRLRGEMRALLRVGPWPVVWPRVGEWLGGCAGVRRIAVFAPLAGEPDLLPLVGELGGFEWVFPRVLGGGLMELHVVGDVDAGLRAGAFGVREPAAEAPVVAVDSVDVFLCPGLAFDRRGGRLGRGGGYYDRMLAGARAGALKAGVCFSKQLVDSTYAEAHDVRMDVLISELGVVTREGAG